MDTFQSCKSLTTANFPACSYIGASAFQYCSSLTEADFPACSYIGGSPFAGCYSLITANFPVCSYIGSYAFISCSSLTTVSFPACSSIGNYAFQNCSALNTLYLLGSSIVSIPGLTVFYGTPFANPQANTSIYVPASLVNSYKTATIWSGFSSKFVGV